MPISYATVLVLGRAKKGPIVKYKVTVKIRPYIGCTRLANDCKLSFPEIASARTVSTGNPTPVNRKPRFARNRFSPAACPNNGGKIKLPAPKKIMRKA